MNTQYPALTSPTSNKVDIFQLGKISKDMDDLSHRQQCPCQTREELQEARKHHKTFKKMFEDHPEWYQFLPFVLNKPILDKYVLHHTQQRKGRGLSSMRILESHALSQPWDEIFFNSNVDGDTPGVPILDILKYRDTMADSDSQPFPSFGLGNSNDHISLQLPPHTNPLTIGQLPLDIPTGCPDPLNCPSKLESTPSQVPGMTKFGLAFMAAQFVLHALEKHRENTLLEQSRSRVRHSTALTEDPNPLSLVSQLRLCSVYSAQKYTWFIRLSGPRCCWIQGEEYGGTMINEYIYRSQL